MNIEKIMIQASKRAIKEAERQFTKGRVNKSLEKLESRQKSKTDSKEE